MDKMEEIRDGKKVYVYDNGSVQDANTGHWISPPPSGVIRTTERSHELLARRNEIAREKIIEGIREGLGLPVTALPGEEVRELARITTAAFKDSQNIRGMDSLLRTLLTLGGYVEPEAMTDQRPASVLGAEILELLRELARVARDFKEQERIEVINGDVS